MLGGMFILSPESNVKPFQIDITINHKKDSNLKFTLASVIFCMECKALVNEMVF